ncbi:MAG: tetratricopeptide repeat protein, partial [Polyangiaceae bacterium]
DMAVADVKQYQKDFGNSHANEAAQIAFAIGAHYADKEDWANARKALSGAMGALDRAPPDIQVQAHATLARALMHLKSEKTAQAEYARVRKIWGDGSAAQAKIADAYKTEGDDQRAHRIGKALDAVGEALFFAAEDKKKEKVDSLPFPIYKGKGTKDDVLKYMDKSVKPWVQKKQEVIAEVDKEYQKITDLQPVPPPRWVIAAASRAGLMWGNFVDDFRRAPYPKDWDKKGFVPGTGDTLSWSEIRANYLEHLDEASEPIKVSKSKPALKRCLDDSVKYQYFDEYSRDCEKWLAKNYKTEYHVVDELRGVPTLSNGGLDDHPPPLIIGGQMWHPVDTGPATEKAVMVDSGSGGSTDNTKKKSRRK